MKCIAQCPHLPSAVKQVMAPSAFVGTHGEFNQTLLLCLFVLFSSVHASFLSLGNLLTPFCCLQLPLFCKLLTSMLGHKFATAELKLMPSCRAYKVGRLSCQPGAWLSESRRSCGGTEPLYPPK